MATIVRTKKEKQDYILIGTGFGAFQSEAPSVIFGNLDRQKHRGNLPIVFVCNHEGHIGWFPAKSVEVVSIDGHPPKNFV